MSQKKVIRYKLVRHKWPDEIAAEKEAKVKKRKQKIKRILMFVCIFGLGVACSRVLFPMFPNENFKKLYSIYEVMSEKWYFGKDIEDLDEKLLEGAMSGLVNSGGDRNTVYMSKEYTKSFNSSMEGNSVGIGISYILDEQDIPIVTQVFQDSSADQAGLEKGDKIISINGIKVSELEMSISEYIESFQDQAIPFQIQRGEETLEYQIQPSLYHNSIFMEVEDDVALLHLSSFSDTSGDDFGKHLKTLKEEGIRDLVIDLRNNGGGYLVEAQKIISYLLPENTVIFKEVQKDGTVVEYSTKKGQEVYTFDHITLLVNGNTASASEVLIQALKYYLDVTIVGEQTYGKGTMQVPLAFKDGTTLKYTIAEWTGPDDKKIHGVGIQPDIEVSLPDAIRVSAQLEENEEVHVDEVNGAVKAAQLYLEFLGYQVDRTDGYYSYASEAIVKEYQKDNGLTIDGIIDEELLTHMVRRVSVEYHLHAFEKDAQLVQAMEVAHGA